MDIEQFKIKWTEYLDRMQFKSVECMADRKYYMRMVKNAAKNVEPIDMLTYIIEELRRNPDNKLSQFFIDWCNKLYGPDAFVIEGFVSYRGLSQKILEFFD